MRLSRALPAVLLGAALVLTGCGKSEGGSGGGSDKAEDAPSATALLDKAKTSFEAAPASRVIGSVVDGTDTITLDVTNDLAGNGKGSIGLGGKGTAQIIVVGKTAYLSGDKEFWTATGGGEGAAMLLGKWVQTPVTSSDVAQLTAFLDRKGLWGEVFTGAGNATVAEGPGGSSWIVSDGDGGTLVLDKATGRPLSLKGKDGSESVDLAMSYPASAEVTAPAKDKILKLG